MAKAQRSAQFVRDRLPAVGAKVEVLCQNADGVHKSPFLSAWTDDGWVIAGTRRTLNFEVIGWRQPRNQP